MYANIDTLFKMGKWINFFHHNCLLQPKRSFGLCTYIILYLSVDFEIKQGFIKYDLAEHMHCLEGRVPIDDLYFSILF